MLGKHFVATRQRLFDSYADVRLLAQQAQVAPDHQTQADDTLETLKRPFLITVCGEINAGKSSLINALQGRYLCRVNDLPETDVPTLHSYGEARREVMHGGKWRECQWPDESLMHVHWLDLPGIDAVGKTAYAQWQPWLQASEVVMVVFSHRNPWGAVTWDFLAKWPEEMRDSLVFVVQACDEAVAADLPVLSEHLRDLSQKRLGRVPPVFLVSARDGLQVTKRSVFASNPVPTGLAQLHQWLDARVNGCEERQRAMESLRRAALALLYKTDEILDGMSRSVLRDVRFLEDLEREIEQLFQHTVRQQVQSLGAIGEEYFQQSQSMARLLRKRLGLLRSIARLMLGENTALQLEVLLQERLTEAVKAAADRDAGALVDDCAAHWRTVQERLGDLDGAPSAPWSAIEPRLQEARRQLVERMGLAAGSSVGQLRVRGILSSALRQRNTGLSMWLSCSLVMLLAAGLTGGFFIPWAPSIFCGLAGFFGICLALFGMRTARDMVEDYRERLLRSGESFFSALRGDYEEGLRLFFREYAQGLQGIRESLSRRENSLQPYTQRWNELFLKIKAIEQEMGDECRRLG